MFHPSGVLTVQAKYSLFGENMRPDNFRSFGQTRRALASPGSGKRGGSLPGHISGFSQCVGNGWACVEKASRGYVLFQDITLVKTRLEENQAKLWLVAYSLKKNGFKNVQTFVTHIRGVEAVYVCFTDADGCMYTTADVCTETKTGALSPGWPNRLQKAINKSKGK
mgnify:CR=1 FL=1|tara:strand:+ start:9723 stop:10220 length:498 start_codon:yes stop_codon:yes gene_type:complete